MTFLRILFAALLCVPVLGLAVYLIEKLIDDGLKRPGRKI